MKDGFSNIVHSLISLVLGLLLIHTNLDTGRRFAFAIQSCEQIRASPAINRMEDIVDLPLGMNSETDNTCPESDESGQEENEVLDFLYTRPDTILLSRAVSSGEGMSGHSFDANPENIPLDTTSPPPKS